MAKRPPRGRCVHCLSENVVRNWDHVFPKAWYPDTTPKELYKWQIPSCEQCNSEYGAMEEEMLLRLALCIDRKASGASGVVERVLRSLRPEFGRNQGDRIARAAKARRIKAEVISGTDIPQQLVYPGLGERWARPLESGTGLSIPKRSFQRLAEKLLEGCITWNMGDSLSHHIACSFTHRQTMEQERRKRQLSSLGKNMRAGAGLS